MEPSDLFSRAVALVAECVGDAAVAATGAGTSVLADQLRLATAAAAACAELQPNPALHAATYLHKFVYNGELALPAVAAACGERVAWLCAEAARLFLETADTPGRGKPRARQRARYFGAAYRDPELALLAVATLWGAFRLVQDAAPAQRHAFAEEARHVLGPLLDMLGMRAWREELDLWLWRLHDPDAERAGQSCRELFDEVQMRLATALPAATIVYRPCPPAAPQRPGDPQSTGRGAPPAIEVSLLLPDEESCYRSLYWLHHQFAPVDGSVVDFLRAGRINGACALQTTVHVMAGNHSRGRVLFALCTPAQEEVNRWGLAAIHARRRLAAKRPAAWWNHAGDGYAHIAAAAPGSLPDVLYVFSPQGQLFRFTRGCTVVDYAYYVHSELADRCQRFYINDEVAEPTTPLHHLDVVALEHDERAPGPTQVWLNAAHTGRARSAIERFLKRRGLGVDQGQRILDRRRRSLEEYYGFNLPDHRVGQATVSAARQYKLGRPDELFAEIAAGRIDPDRILRPLFADEIIRQIRLPRESGLRPHQLLVAQCCRPRPGEDIVGLVTRRGDAIQRLRVHRADCVQARAAIDPLPLQWRLQPRLKLMTQMEVTAHDEERLLGDALAQIYVQRPRVTIHKAEAVASHGVARLRFTLEAENAEVLDQIAAALTHLPRYTIVEVRQMRLPPSELDAAMQLSAAGVNPYSRLPVNEQAMFFGRSQELLQIYEWLAAGAGNIWLMGQKRMGKTSLLLHLKNYYLRDRGFVLAFVDFQLLGDLATGNIYFEIANAVHAELQTDPRIGDLGAPLSAVFAHQPPMQLMRYLRSIRSRLGANRLVLLLDEFSRATDAYLQGDLDHDFFDEWRGLLQATAPEISYITVFQQQTYTTLSQHAQHAAGDPSWQLMELGETMTLKPLTASEVRRLIEWPLRNFLEYTPAALDRVARLTGGNPFLIQVFCFRLTGQMARSDRRRIEVEDIETVAAEFMQPTENVFTHFLDMVRGGSQHVIQQAALVAGDGQPVTWDALAGALSSLPADRLRRSLDALVAGDILIERPPVEWEFASLLFQQWLAQNPA
jgi:(p)ppGpp synthase/HD superfamily hydrolase